MPRATRRLKDRLAIVFDFDETLGRGSVDVLLKDLGVDPEAFRDEHVAPLDADGWDHSLARFKALIDLSNARDGAITHEKLRAVGRNTPLFEGVPELFDTLRRAADGIAEGVTVEFYILTAGFAEVPQATPIAHEFNAIWGSAAHFDDEGRLDFPKRVVTYPEKVRYLMQLAKGLSVDGADSPSDVFREVPERDWHVPFDQMIYVGDGSSDLPAFDLIEDQGGIAIGVFGPEGDASSWSEAHEVHAQRRVENLAPADYSDGSELLQALVFSVESIAKLISVRRLGEWQ